MSIARDDTQPDDRPLLEVGRHRIQAEVQAVAAMANAIDDHFLTALHLIESRHGKVLVSGAGTSAAVARRMAHLLAVTGTAALYLDPGESIHGSLGAVEPGDVLIAISKNGGSAEVNTMAERAAGRGASLLVLTSNPDSPLAKLATLAITLALPEESDLGDIVAMGSTLAVSAWGDALAAALMEQRSYSWRDVLYTHPGGAVGQLEAPDGSSSRRKSSVNVDQGV
ncbi:MAG TPA: SIS domain-containing protein [Ktedonobacteraceae bacterium]|nr:SIS domain-containing protein [Ktedonobacteraceae bacterium]